MKKRILSLVLALVMTLSLLPATVWASQDAAQTAQTDAAAETVTGDVPLTEEKEEPEEKEETTPQEKTAQEEGQDETQQTPDDTDADSSTPLLKELRLASRNDWENSYHYLENTAEKIASGEKEFSAWVDDVYSTAYAWASAAEGCSVRVNGEPVNNETATLVIKGMDGSAAQKLTVVVTSPDGTETETYTVTFTRKLTLKRVALMVNGKAVLKPTFKRDIYAYEANIEAGTKEMTLDVTSFTGYTILLDGQEITSPHTLTLDSTKAEETFVLSAGSGDAKSYHYTVTVKKKGLVPTTVNVSPVGALVAIYDSRDNSRVWPGSDGKFQLMEGVDYTYVATCAGYVGKSETFTAAADSPELPITLAAAVPSTPGGNVSSLWPSFRGNDENNGVVSFKTPVKRDEAVLSWATKIGNGYDKRVAASCPILITQGDADYLIVSGGDILYKVDALTGKTVAQKKMSGEPSYAIIPPTYGGGMLFVALDGGKVEAFDAATLESLWLYTDPLGGRYQSNCPITYDDQGYIYVGFWESETAKANLVCLSVTDEDPARADESKLARWTYTTKGGYYWAGAYVNEKYVMVGTDDGESGYKSPTGKLLVLDKATGALVDAKTDYAGDIRSSITYVDGRIYFTSKGGYLYSEVVGEDGRIDAAQSKAVPLGGMSTSTPVVYKGRAYVGVSGSSQFTAYSGHNITVIDLKSWKIAYRVETKGYPQTSGLLTTAYESVDGCTYVYFIDNFTPGVLRVLKDKPGQTEPVLTEKEVYVEDGVDKEKMTAPILFEPAGKQAAYAICSPIADRYGTLYFKNDSGYLMALTSAVTKIEVTTNPEKMLYGGEVFDPTGMELAVTYANGVSRAIPADRVTDCAEWSTEPPTNGTFFINYSLALYSSGKEELVIEPAILKLTIRGDLNKDGEVDVYDLQRLYEHCNGINRFTGNELADVGLRNDDILEVQNLYSFLTTGRWDSSEKTA